MQWHARGEWWIESWPYTVDKAMVAGKPRYGAWVLGRGPWRTPGGYIPLGCFDTAAAAKRACEAHSVTKEAA